MRTVGRPSFFGPCATTTGWPGVWCSAVCSPMALSLATSKSSQASTWSLYFASVEMLPKRRKSRYWLSAASVDIGLLRGQRLGFAHERSGRGLGGGLVAGADEVLAGPDVPRFVELGQRRVLKRLDAGEILRGRLRGRVGRVVGIGGARDVEGRV